MHSTEFNEKVIGANLLFKLKTSFDTYTFELLIDTKSLLVEFSIIGVESEFRDIIISILKKRLKTELSQTISASLMNELSSNVFYRSYWYYICEKVNFFLNPIPNNLLAIDDRICRCFNVSQKEIEDIIASGASDLLTITNLTKAGGGCTSCRTDIEALLGDKNVESIEEASEDAFVVTEQKREKILEMWPVDFLESKVFPLIDTYNKENDGDAQVVQLIENHLYIKSKNAIINLEDFLNLEVPSISLFYV